MRVVRLALTDGAQATSQLAANNGRAAAACLRYLTYCPLLVDVTWLSRPTRLPANGAGNVGAISLRDL